MQVTVAAFNVRSRTAPPDIGVPNRDWQERRPAAADAVLRTGACVVGLQEVDEAALPTSQAAELLETMLQRGAPATWHQIGATRYCAMLWDDAVVQRVTEPVTWDVNVAHLRPGAQHVMMYVEFVHRDSGLRFGVASTQFQHNSAVMRQEAAQVVISRLASRTVPVVVVGDVNDGDYTPAAPLQVLWDGGYRASNKISETPVVNEQYNSYNAFIPTPVEQGWWIDVVAPSPEWTVKAAGLDQLWEDGEGPPLAMPFASDHYPVWARLEWSPGTGPIPTPTVPVDFARTPVVEFVAGELRTGRIFAHLAVEGGSWSTVLGDDGEVRVTVPLAHLPVRQSRELRSMLEEYRCLLGVLVDGQAVQAGPIVDSRYDGTTSTARVRARGLRHLWTKRRLVKDGVAAGDLPSNDLSWSGLSLATIAKRGVQESLKQTAGGLPLALPDDAAGTHERIYPGYQIRSVASVLDDLSGVIGGPEIAFRARSTGDGLGIEWSMDIGDPLLVQSGRDHVFDLTAPRSSASLVSLVRDGSARVNRAFATDGGFEEALRVAEATNESQWDLGYPLLEDVSAHSTVEKLSTLTDHAAARRDSGSRSVVTWAVTASIAADPRLGGYREGDWAQIRVQGDRWVNDGVYRARVASISHSIDSTMADVTFVPTLEGR